jgi:hypothetical protein
VVQFVPVLGTHPVAVLTLTSLIKVHSAKITATKFGDMKEVRS